MARPLERSMATATNLEHDRAADGRQQSVLKISVVIADADDK
jgi:hypothetical protein